MGEIRDLLISAFVLALAFSIMFAGGLKRSILSLFPISLMTVSVGFVFHELAHRYAARSFGCFAEYRMWPPGLLLALLFAPLGVVFAAPGAVMIWPRVDIWAPPGLAREEGIWGGLAGWTTSEHVIGFDVFLAQHTISLDNNLTGS